MSRNKVDSNKKIFKRLDDYVAARGDEISNRDQSRWIGTDEKSREFLIRAKFVRSLEFSARMLISQFDFEDTTFLVTAGFETTDIPEGLIEEDLTPGILTAFLAESSVQPNAQVLSVRTTVEYSDARSPEYLASGHGFQEIAALFPSLQVFSTAALERQESENIFLLLCLADRRRVELWMEDTLVSKLEQVATLGASRIPYASLCRSCMDTDPGNLYLALYRSLENQYSRRKVTELMESVGIARDWTDMARLLGDKLNWYPRELESLEDLLGQVGPGSLAVTLEAFGSANTDEPKQANAVAKLIYGLRNTLVHYRPFHQAPDPALDWNKVCAALCQILCDLA